MSFNVTRIVILPLLVVSAAFLVSASAAMPQQRTARLGEPVPSFTLQDLDGKSYDFARDFGQKHVIIQWFNPDCPFVVNVYRDGTVAKTVSALKALGDDYAYLAINSTATKPREYIIQSSKSFLKQYGVDIPVLVDDDGAVGKLFDARTTPQVFVVDKGTLRYLGAFTDNPWSKQETTFNYALNAINQLKDGETVSPDYQKPWGCSVKYRRE